MFKFLSSGEFIRAITNQRIMIIFRLHVLDIGIVHHIKKGNEHWDVTPLPERGIYAQRHNEIYNDEVACMNRLVVW